MELTPKDTLKYGLRELIFKRDPVVINNLLQGTMYLYSEQFPTQVFQMDGKKYIRINKKELEEYQDTVANVIRLLSSIEDYSYTEDQDEPILNDLLEKAITSYYSQTGMNLSDTDLLEVDELGNVIDCKLEIEPKVWKNTQEEKEKQEEEIKEESKEEESSCATKDACKIVSAIVPESHTEKEKQDQKPQQEIQVEQEIEQALDKVKQYESKSRFHSSTSVLSKDKIKKLHKTANKLLKAFQGKKGKVTSITPSKRLNTKSLATDRDNIYVKSTDPKGKQIKFNLLIDMSGSMYGSPIQNAVSLIYLFNLLAQQGYVQGSVFYSTTDKHYKLSLPADPAEVLALNEVQNAEGLADTIKHYQEDLKHMNLICITDGDIVDKPIDKRFWQKNRIVSYGVYVNEHADDVTKYTGSLNKWFNYSLVRKNLDDLIELLVKLGLKG